MNRPVAPRLLPPAAARTLYNAADALLPPEVGSAGFDWVPGVEAALRRRGEPAARRLRALLRRLEWTSRLRGGGAFFQRPRGERAELLGRLAGPSHAFLLELLAEAASSSGAGTHSSGE